MNRILATLVVCAGTAAASAYASERDHIMIVGSSTVYPFSTLVAERGVRSGEFEAPTVESTGTGGGIKLFCKGIGTNTPDIVNASRRMKKTESDLCLSNGVTGIIEILIGYDGIVLANTREAPVLEVSTRDIYLALAKDIPAPDGSETFVPNPHRKWSDVNPSLPETEIRVFGPPPTSGTRDAFVELALEGGCRNSAWVKGLEKSDGSQYKARCRTIREDGRYVEAGENDNLIIQKLVSDRNAFGVFGFSFLDQNLDKVQGAVINGSSPEFDLIVEGDYPVSRPLYFYAKRDHIGVIPGVQAYIDEFISENAIGRDGYLLDRGLIPAPDEDRAKYRVGIAAVQSVSQ